MQARRAEVLIIYNGKDISADLAESLMDLSYTDNPSGQLDDLQITLEDKDRKWQGDWSPTIGDSITASLRTISWDKQNEVKTFPLGTFGVDSATLNGPPDTVQIKALSLPAGTTARHEIRSKAWEKVRLKTIAGDIAKRAELTLLYEAPDNPIYDRLEQTEQADMPFLLDLCTKEGIAVKVAAGKLVLFDESVYEQKSTVATLTRGTDNVIGYSFGWSVTEAAYRAAQLVYTTGEGKKKTEVKAVFTPPGAPASGPVLKLNESVSSEAEALRVAKNRLREENKNYGKASLQLPGDIRMAAGLTINIVGWGRYDGKYIIESATHSVGSGGYSTSIEIRKVLGW
ncbi:late control protein [Paenibacillus sp. BIHB 4019]|uniref:Late control protein n=1 Tax=Paenibacillus sp. BIHB 4019 TaxID=1870819 RepID=A0A1B2DPU3_9BACL|nr:late control protein [Paenibacillus sp. BIHB 4019]ANY69727.1 late control protein [Paenibacillus sp. BIHB 4019]